ncbi:hypothetical protein HDU97_003093 [Phlyctochytrium planicorne]|nr:hypothetical protein HDU97_003045 [Phlyctochytrium planicorne]KAJ3109665.1 hypothetical protein HDU97_003093 [Phlyctochytrium planicorne]
MASRLRASSISERQRAPSISDRRASAAKRSGSVAGRSGSIVKAMESKLPKKKDSGSDESDSDSSTSEESTRSSAESVKELIVNEEEDVPIEARIEIEVEVVDEDIQAHETLIPEVKNESVELSEPAPQIPPNVTETQNAVVEFDSLSQEPRPQTTTLLEDFKEFQRKNRRKPSHVNETGNIGPGEIVAGRRGSIHVGQAPMKLTVSELDLLSQSTGAFRGGAGDAQRRFLSLTGGTVKSVRLAGPGGSLALPLATQMSRLIEESDPERGNKSWMGRKTATQRAREKARGFDDGPLMAPKISVGLLTSAGSTEGLDHLTVGKGPKQGFKDRNKRGNMAYLKAANPGKFKKQKAREIARSYLLSKWERLEEVRIRRKENSDLKEEHKGVLAETNGRISAILKDIEKANLEIAVKEKDRKRKLKRLQEEHKQFEINGQAEIAQVEFGVARIQKAVDDLTHDIKSLIDFKEMINSDSSALQKLVAAEFESKKEIEQQRLAILDAVRARWEDEQRDEEATWMARVKILMDKMSEKVSGKIDCSPDGDVRRNMRLRKELALHDEQMRIAKNEIQRILDERQDLKEKIKKLDDPRRKVFHLSDQMTCTPDMEFEVRDKRVENYGIENIA